MVVLVVVEHILFPTKVLAVVVLVVEELDGNKDIHMEEVVYTSLNMLVMAHQEVTSLLVAVEVDGQGIFMVLVLVALVVVDMVVIMETEEMVLVMDQVEEQEDIQLHLEHMVLQEQYSSDTKKKTSPRGGFLLPKFSF
jgi:hypothetical protein